MKQWVKKLLSQLEVDWQGSGTAERPPLDINEDRATLLYLIDVYNKHLFDFDKHPVRKTRESLDAFAKALLSPENPDYEKILFRLRQFFSTYRIDEFSYIQQTFDDFKNIIWDFADQLSEDINEEQTQSVEIKKSLNQLREAVEANSIEELRSRSREFIDYYVEIQSRNEERQKRRIHSIKNNLDTIKKKLVQANQNLQIDHLTRAYNRKSFDEQIKKYSKMSDYSNTSVTLLMLDIDHFKSVNDTYGHDMGDYILVECVKLLKSVFNRSNDFIARVGGEEFAILLPDFKVTHALKKAEELLTAVRKEVFIKGEDSVNFTVSIGVAQHIPGENSDKWIKRADSALYESKETGRNKYTVAPHPWPSNSVA